MEESKSLGVSINNIVSFEQAMILAEIYDFRYTNRSGKRPHHIYDSTTKELRDADKYTSLSSPRVWNGMGWTYQWYLAPTKDEAIEFLMEIIDNLNKYIENTAN